MPTPTYSINVGQPTEATRLEDINAVLSELPDNTTKLISPRDVRNAVFTTWETISIKTTNAPLTSYDYIGVDYPDTRNKMLFGKKTIAGSYVMSNSLLTPTNDTDIFFYNNKSDSNLSQQDLKISFLAGTNSLIWPDAPYMEFQAVAGSSSYIDFNIQNPSIGGSININSAYGDVTINGIKLPTSAENAALSSTYSGYTLTYDGFGKLVWSEISISTTSIVSGGPVTISGSPVIINGSPIEFTDATPVVTTIGGITPGMTFSNEPVVEVLRKIIYPYLSPLCSLSSNVTLIEYGTYPTVTLSWTITKRSNSVTFASLPNSGFVSGAPYTTSTSGTTNGVYSVNTNQTWTFTVSDVGASQSATASDTAQLVNVYPYFYGMDANASLSGHPLYIGLVKLVQSQSNKVVNLAGTSKYIYFAYPASYPNLTQIIDNNGFDVTSSFTQSTVTVSSSGLVSNWSLISYKVYRSNLVTTLGGVNYTFKY